MTDDGTRRRYDYEIGNKDIGFLSITDDGANQTYSFTRGDSDIDYLHLSDDGKTQKYELATFKHDVLNSKAGASTEPQTDGYGEYNLSLADTDALHLTAKTSDTEHPEADGGRTGSWDVWTQIYGARTHAGSTDSDLWVGYIGTHYYLNDQTIVGLWHSWIPQKVRAQPRTRGQKVQAGL